MNRLALVLVAVLSSYAVACAAPTGDETVATPTVAEEEPAAEVGENKPHSAPATPAEQTKQEEAAFAVERIGEKRIIPTPTPKPGVEEVGELDVQLTY